jgi:hypothetical protein
MRKLRFNVAQTQSLRYSFCMSNNTASNEVTINEIQNNKVLCSWQELSLEKAIGIVHSLKITGLGKVFSIESKSGTILEVIRM